MLAASDFKMFRYCCEADWGGFNISVLLKSSYSGNCWLFCRFTSKLTDVENSLEQTAALSVAGVSCHYDCSDVPQDKPDATSSNKVTACHICIHEYTSEHLMELLVTCSH